MSVAKPSAVAAKLRETADALFVKAGSVLPLGPDVQYATEKTDKPTELRV